MFPRTFLLSLIRIFHPILGPFTAAIEARQSIKVQVTEEGIESAFLRTGWIRLIVGSTKREACD